MIEVAGGGNRGRPHTPRSSPTPTRVLGDPAPVRVLGIDETRRGKPRCWTRDQASGRWARTDPGTPGSADPAGDQGPPGQAEGRTGAAARQWLSEQRGLPGRHSLTW